VLEQVGFAIDLRKYTQGGEVPALWRYYHSHPRWRGWFDPLSDAKGDVFGLAQNL